MPNIQIFEDLQIWKRAHALTVEIYKSTKTLRDYSFIDQIRRASVSISNNIAEGFERKSEKEFKNFLNIAKGSCGEVRSMLHVGYPLDYFDKRGYDRFISETTEISRMIAGFMKSLN